MFSSRFSRFKIRASRISNFGLLSTIYSFDMGGYGPLNKIRTMTLKRERIYVSIWWELLSSDDLITQN
jgi:hypothetical protein